MRWPWVSHDTLVELIQTFGTQMGTWRAEQDAKYADLLEKYHALAMPTPPIVAAPVRPVVQAEPSFISTIIRDQSKHDPRLAAYLKAYATQLKQDGLTEDEIGLALTQWTTTEGISS